MIKKKNRLGVLPLVGLLIGSGCSEEFKSKFDLSREKLSLTGKVINVRSVELSDLNKTSSIYVNLALDLDKCQSCSRLDKIYHYDDYQLAVNLSLSHADIPELKSGYIVRFSLYEGYVKTKRKDSAGRTLLWLNESPLNAKLEAYTPKEIER